MVEFKTDHFPTIHGMIEESEMDAKASSQSLTRTGYLHNFNVFSHTLFVD